MTVALKDYKPAIISCIVVHQHQKCDMTTPFLVFNLHFKWFLVHAYKNRQAARTSELRKLILKCPCKISENETCKHKFIAYQPCNISFHLCYSGLDLVDGPNFINYPSLRTFLKISYTGTYICIKRMDMKISSNLFQFKTNFIKYCDSILLT